MFVSYNDIQKMNELYLQHKTYAAVARLTGFSPSTVKKYIQPDYQPMEERPIKKFEGELPKFDPKPFRCSDWGPMCELTPDEIKEVRELWKELLA